MKNTAEKLVEDLVNNIGHPLFFEGYDILMRDEKKFLKNQVKSEIRKLKRNISQKFGILIGCIFSFLLNLLWLIFVPIFSCFQIIKMMLLIPYKIKEHQKLIFYIQSHPEYEKIQNEVKKRKR